MKEDIIDIAVKKINELVSKRDSLCREHLHGLRGTDLFSSETIRVINEEDYISMRFAYDINKWRSKLNDALYKLLKIKTLKNKELNGILERVYSSGIESYGHWEGDRYVTRRTETATNQKIRWYS